MTSEQSTFRAWITKYALSTGIREVDASITKDFPFMIGWKDKRGYAQYTNGAGTNWHRTHADAIKRAEQMRDAKIASLRKQIAKLEKMTFGETKP